MAVKCERLCSYLRRSHQRKVVTTNDEKSAEIIVAMSMREGLNETNVKIGGTEPLGHRIEA